MDFKEFSEANRTRCEAVNGFNHMLYDWSSSDWMTAVAGELGEAANIIKKLNRVRDGIPGNKKSAAELFEDLAGELADTFTYLDLLSQAVGVDLQAAVIKKFNEKSADIGYPVVLVG